MIRLVLALRDSCYRLGARSDIHAVAGALAVFTATLAVLFVPAFVSLWLLPLSMALGVLGCIALAAISLGSLRPDRPLG